MTSFIKRMVAGNERIIGQTRVHWIYLFQGILWFMGISIAGLRLNNWMLATIGPPITPLYWISRVGLPVTPETPLLPMVFFAFGLWTFGVYLFKYIGTEIALTSQRIIYKTGVLFVDTLEVDLVEIRSETVHHGFLGRWLGYGRIRLDSRFVGDTFLPAVPHPYGLLKALNKARTGVHDPMTDAVPGDTSPHATPAEIATAAVPPAPVTPPPAPVVAEPVALPPPPPPAPVKAAPLAPPPTAAIPVVAHPAAAAPVATPIEGPAIESPIAAETMDAFAEAAPPDAAPAAPPTTSPATPKE